MLHTRPFKKMKRANHTNLTKENSNFQEMKLPSSFSFSSDLISSDQFFLTSSIESLLSLKSRKKNQNTLIYQDKTADGLAVHGLSDRPTTSGLSGSRVAPLDKPEQLKREYHRCLDVDRFRAQYLTIRNRIWQSHVVKGNHLVDLEREEAKKRKVKKKGSDLQEEQKLIRLESELFEKNVVSQYNQKWAKDEKVKRLGSTAARRLGLAKADEFTGTEAEALHKLLRTLHTRTWDPKLYFHIRFFSIRHELHPISQETKLLIRQRWHFILRVLRTAAKIERVLAARSCEKTKNCVTYLDIVEAAIKPIFWGPHSTLPFDKDSYKVLTDTMLSVEAKTILRDKMPKERTAEEIHQAVLSLQYVTAFAKLPTAIQHSLVADAYYIWVGSKRIVIRQGQTPQNYYFILHGQAVCKRFLPCSDKSETTAILRKGDGFGSVAMINKSPRLWTVVSQTPLHLLVVPKATFTRNFIQNKHDSSLNTVHFLSKMWFMQTWPIDVLMKCSHQCHTRQFRRAEIIEADVSQSVWIYVVRKGICRVYQRVSSKKKNLQRITSESFQHRPSHSQSFAGKKYSAHEIRKSSSIYKPGSQTAGLESEGKTLVECDVQRTKSASDTRAERTGFASSTSHSAHSGPSSVSVALNCDQSEKGFVMPHLPLTEQKAVTTQQTFGFSCKIKNQIL